MKIMYCWRCGLDVPMLDEQEFEVVAELYTKAVIAIKKGRIESRETREQLITREQFIIEQYRPVFEAHRRLTGRDLSADPSHLMFHRIRKYGPPCSYCGKPLRTPRATYCAACGTPSVSACN